MIPDADHHLMVDQPLAFVSALRGLLAGWPGRLGHFARTRCATRPNSTSTANGSIPSARHRSTSSTRRPRRPAGRISLGSAEDVDRAVQAARRAFDSLLAHQPRGAPRPAAAHRRGLPGAHAARWPRRSPPRWARPPGWPSAPRPAAGSATSSPPPRCSRATRSRAQRGTTLVAKEPIGVCGFITPWNWPVNQIACKVAPALAVGCTMVLKPSEVAPLSAHVLAEILHEAGVPAGVFNLVDGDGPTVGAALSAHPEVDMVSFTGSTRAGIEVARNAAPTVKRVHQELGGKSPNIILDDEGFAAAVEAGRPGGDDQLRPVLQRARPACSCRARGWPRPPGSPPRVADATPPGDPAAGAKMGPVVSEAAVEQDPGPDREGRRGRRRGRRRRAGQARRAGDGLLRPPDHLRRRAPTT